MSFDFPVTNTVTAADETTLREALADHDAVRLAGTGSAQSRIPVPGEAVPVTVVSTAGMDRILRLEADDLTCSVQAGVRRDVLDAELASLGLWLPCEGTGTIGGIFAADETGPAGPSQPEPRSLLLGITGLLPEGMRFRSGARVVKNVAGFDLQKLLVGSRGRYFAAMELHLKLRPLPRSTRHFANRDLPLEEAVAQTARLRTHASRPIRLELSGSRDRGFEVRGTLAGDPQHLDRVAIELALTVADNPQRATDDPERITGSESIQGQMQFRRVRELLELLPAAAWFEWRGERFAAHLPSDTTDAVLARLPDIGAAAEITESVGARRGVTTPLDPASTRLARDLKAALDPRGVLR